MARPLPPHGDQAHAAITSELVRLCLPHDPSTDRLELWVLDGRIAGPTQETTEPDESRLERLRWWLLLKWWDLRARMHRCPECGTRPDPHWSNAGPRWEDDKVAQMLGIAQYGCPRCSHGAIHERDATKRFLAALDEIEASIEENR